MTRSSSYTPEILAEICERLSQGEPLEQICRDEHMPASRTVYDWADGKVASVPESIPADIARARDIGYDAIASNARMTARGRGESTQDVARDKLIIETDLKLLAKWSKKYGDKITQELTGKDGKDLPAREFTIVIDKNSFMSDDTSNPAE